MGVGGSRQRFGMPSPDPNARTGFSGAEQQAIGLKSSMPPNATTSRALLLAADGGDSIHQSRATSPELGEKKKDDRKSSASIGESLEDGESSDGDENASIDNSIENKSDNSLASSGDDDKSRASDDGTGSMRTSKMPKIKKGNNRLKVNTELEVKGRRSFLSNLNASKEGSLIRFSPSPDS